MEGTEIMPHTTHAPARSPRIALAAIAAGLAGLAAYTMAGDRLLAESLEGALAAAAPGGALRQPSAQTALAPVAGSEAFWLDVGKKPLNAAGLKRANWAGSVSIGDRYEFGGGNSKRVLEVTDVRPSDVAGLRAPAATGSEQEGHSARLLVSLRDILDEQRQPIEMLIAADAPLAGMTPLAKRGAHDL